MLPPPPANAASVNKLPMGTPSPISVDPTSSSGVTEGTVGASKAGSLRQSTTPYHHHTRTAAVNRSATISSRELTLQNNTVATRLTKYPTSISTRANTHAKATATNMASATALGSSLRYAAKPATVPSSSVIAASSSLAQSGQTPSSLHRPVAGLSHYTIPSEASSISTKKKGGQPLRRGKWTTEEEAYAARLIHEFKSGLLPLTDGTTLRNFLSKLLNCDPMRISKVILGHHYPRTVCAQATD